MSFAVDTNVLLRSVDDRHPVQPIVQNCLLALRNHGEILSIFPQNLVEFWAVATRPVANNGLGWSTAQAEKEFMSLKSLFLLLPDLPQIFDEWEKIVMKHRVAGKQVHDARLVAAMTVHQVTRLLTFNTVDFERFTSITVINPESIS